MQSLRSFVMKKISLLVVAVTSLTLGARAFADDQVTCPTPEVAPPPPAVQGPEPVQSNAHQPALGGIGMALHLGGGLDDFSGDTMRNTTGVGFGWTARVLFGTHSIIAGELSYIGSAQAVDRFGLSGRSTLYGNGAQADVRLNMTTAYFLQPFLYGGVAWRHYSLSTGSTNTSDISDSTDTFEVPFGAGIATYVHEIAFEVRAEYRFAWADHAIVPGPNGNAPLLDRWGISSSAGIAF
jgi:hypothetical protein